MTKTSLALTVVAAIVIATTPADKSGLETRTLKLPVTGCATS